MPRSGFPLLAVLEALQRGRGFGLVDAHACGPVCVFAQLFFGHFSNQICKRNFVVFHSARLLSTQKYHMFPTVAMGLAEVRIILSKLRIITVTYEYIYKILTDYWFYRYILLYFVPI